MNKKIIAVAVVLLIVLVVVLGIYGYHLYSNRSTSTASQGILDLAVHDLPPDAVGVNAALYIAFNMIMVHQASITGSSGGWYNISVSKSSIDITALTSISAAKVVGTGALPAGHYTDIWMKIMNASISSTMYSGNLAVPSNATYAKIPGSFWINGSSKITVDIDFSLNINYMMTSHMLSVLGHVDNVNSAGSSEQYGFVALSIHDYPSMMNFTGYVYIYIGFRSITFVSSNGSSFTINNSDLVINITKYTSSAHAFFIWNGSIPAGNYTAVTFTLSNATVNMSGSFMGRHHQMNGKLELNSTNVVILHTVGISSTTDVRLDCDLSYDPGMLLNNTLMVTGTMSEMSM